eukprot:scaffold179852_cov32-Tisochrysis_lutea.AAC.4
MAPTSTKIEHSNTRPADFALLTRELLWLSPWAVSKDAAYSAAVGTILINSARGSHSSQPTAFAAADAACNTSDPHPFRSSGGLVIAQVSLDLVASCHLAECCSDRHSDVQKTVARNAALCSSRRSIHTVRSASVTDVRSAGNSDEQSRALSNTGRTVPTTRPTNRCADELTESELLPFPSVSLISPTWTSCSPSRGVAGELITADASPLLLPELHTWIQSSAHLPAHSPRATQASSATAASSADNCCVATRSSSHHCPSMVSSANAASDRHVPAASAPLAVDGCGNIPTMLWTVKSIWPCPERQLSASAADDIATHAWATTMVTCRLRRLDAASRLSDSAPTDGFDVARTRALPLPVAPTPLACLDERLEASCNRSTMTSMAAHRASAASAEMRGCCNAEAASCAKSVLVATWDGPTSPHMHHAPPARSTAAAESAAAAASCSNVCNLPAPPAMTLQGPGAHAPGVPAGWRFSWPGSEAPPQEG